MAEFNFIKVNSRISLRIDTEENWNNYPDFIPLAGELIIYAVDNMYPFQRFKSGDGVKKLNELPFIIHNPVWAGTSESYNAVKNQLAVGTIVCITDGEGGGAASGETTAKLGQAKLGFMILGQD